jgi:hypothetical protein
VTRITNPIPIFLDRRGALIDAGQIYIGTANADPEAAPIAVYWDSAFTIPAIQPIRTRGGVMVDEDANQAFPYVNADDYSLRIRDADSNEVAYVPTTRLTAATSYQPLDSDLTAIAALTTTSFGRTLLTLANAGALQAAAGIPNCLPLSGGTVTGTITRGSAGAHLFLNDAGMTYGGVFVTEEGAADPTTQPGQIWIELEP